MDKFDLPLSSAESHLLDWVREAMDLRFAQGSGLPDFDVGQRAVLQSLVEVRSRLDRAEELLARATRLRARVSRAKAIAAAAAEEAWDRHASQERESAKRANDFSSAKERTAEANLATMNEKRDLRAAERLCSSADETYEVLRTVYRGLDGLRQDHLAIIRAVAWEDSQSRGGLLHE